MLYDFSFRKQRTKPAPSHCGLNAFRKIFPTVIFYVLSPLSLRTTYNRTPTVTHDDRVSIVLWTETMAIDSARLAQHQQWRLNNKLQPYSCCVLFYFSQIPLSQGIATINQENHFECCCIIRRVLFCSVFVFVFFTRKTKMYLVFFYRKDKLSERSSS